MPYVVTGNCRRCRFTDCVSVCPVDCFHGDDEMLYIDPDACIDCGACVSECPVEAIIDVNDLGSGSDWPALNAAKAKLLPVVSTKQTPLATAEARKLELGL